MEGEKEYDLAIMSWQAKNAMWWKFCRDVSFWEVYAGDTGKTGDVRRFDYYPFPGNNWLMHEGDPNWDFFPTTDRMITYMYYRQVRNTGVPGSSDRYCDELIRKPQPT